MVINLNSAKFENAVYTARINKYNDSFLVQVHSGTGLTKLEAYEDFETYNQAIKFINNKYIKMEGIGE